jgi:hypothetical protein
MHLSSNNCHRKQNPSKKKKKGPGSLTDIENKTHKKKNKQTKQKNKGSGNA